MGAVRLYLLPPVEEIDALEAETLPGVLAQLAALQARIAARMASARQQEADVLLTAKEVAERLRTTTDWVRHRKLPFRVVVSPGQVRYSADGLRRYLEARVEGSC